MPVVVQLEQVVEAAGAVWRFVSDDSAVARLTAAMGAARVAYIAAVEQDAGRLFTAEEKRALLAAGVDGDRLPAEVLEAMAGLVNSCCVGWEGVVMPDGAPLPYSANAKQRLPLPLKIEVATAYVAAMDEAVGNVSGPVA